MIASPVPPHCPLTSARPRSDLAQHCSAAAPPQASACLRSSQVSLTLARVTQQTHTLLHSSFAPCTSVCVHDAWTWYNETCTLVSNEGGVVRFWTCDSAFALMCQKRRLNKSEADSQTQKVQQTGLQVETLADWSPICFHFRLVSLN